MQQDLGSRGFVILAVTNEDRRTVETFVQSNGINYIVGFDRQGTTEAWGVTGYPSAFLIDVRGRVIWEGHPASLPMNTVEQALGEVRRIDIDGRDLSSRFDEVAALVRREAWGGARREVAALVRRGRLDPAESEDATWLLEQLDAIGAEQLAGVEELETFGDYFQAQQILEGLGEDFEGAEFASGIPTRLREYRRRPIRDWVEASELYHRAEAAETAGERDAAARAYASVYRAMQDRPIGAEARTRAERLASGQ